MKKIIVILLVLIFTMTGCSTEPLKDNNQVTVYMLTENERLMKAIKSFNKTYPETNIVFKLGIEDTFKTPSEAKKELNTWLLSGEGPDLIIMDDLDAENYSNSGKLEEISQIIEANQNEFLHNISQNYYSNEKCYYMPLAISLIADSNIPGAFVDFSSLKGLVDSAKKGDYDIRGLSYDNLSAIIYRTEVEPYLKKGNVINQNYLKDFYLLLNDLMKLYDGAITFASYEQTNLRVNRLSQYLNLIRGEGDFAVDYIDTVFDAQCLNSLEEEGKIEFQYKKVDKSYCFIPQGVVSVNAKGRNKEAAEKLVKYLFSEEGQMALLAQDFIPINMAVLENSLDEGHQYDINGEVTIFPWSNYGKEKFIKIMKSTNTPLTGDSHLMEIIMGGAMEYLNGESSLEDATYNTMNKLELYMKE